MRRFTVLTVAFCSAVSFLVGIIVAGGVAPSAALAHQPAPITPRGVARSALSAPAGAVNFADVAERVNAAVVNIDAASRAGQERRRRGADEATPDTPGDLDVPHQGSGSGFIIDRQGFILTNFHVIEDADRITVTLADGRALKGEVVGTDPAIDVALLRIEAPTALEAAPLGDSDALRVGEWVCAIGNPLGYVHSVTVGVVSFMGRKLFDASLDDYIQTDAAINFGNSGGPLINARGEVIGINSAISSRASNIGFAVPINQALAILPQLKAHGRVSRGFVGVYLTDVTPDLQRSLKLAVSRGALVQDVSEGSPAERGGMRPYDIILSVNGREILTNEELIRDISGRQPGSIVRLELLRDGRRQAVQLKLTERPRDPGGADPLPTQRRPAIAPSMDAPLGLTVRELDPGFARRMEIPSSVQGIIVVRIDPTGAAFVPAMRRGFVIMEINRQPVRSVADFGRVVGAARTGDALALYGYDPSLGQRSLILVTVDTR
ncbi:MAG TPA: trypsin-like peptidase domain-containing protein [Vicinamibacterales bacterium]|nr:trypsin-like peptidase domain-containing protein [Vicinamibacterales bacterium]